MADAYCGPSNALQTFQKHTSADRTLQQDRLTQRRSPLEGFRSQDPNAGLLDPEFEAFQASQPGPLPFGEPPAAQFHTFNQRGKQPDFGGFSNGADWAADFQRLQVSSPGPQMQQISSPAQRASPAVMNQAASSNPAQSAYLPRFNQTQYGGYGGSGGFSGMGQNYMQEPQQSQVQPQMQQEVDMFDEAAFERAFDMAREQIMEYEATSTPGLQSEQQAPGNEPYMHLPLLRMAMFSQMMDPTEENMHKFARNFTLLERHDPRLIDFAQWSLFNVILDVARYESTLPFSARYNLRERADALNYRWRAVSREELPESVMERVNKAAAFYSKQSMARQLPLPGTVDYKRTVTDNEMVHDIEQQVSNVTAENVANEVLDTMNDLNPSTWGALRERELMAAEVEHDLMSGSVQAGNHEKSELALSREQEMLARLALAAHRLDASTLRPTMPELLEQQSDFDREQMREELVQDAVPQQPLEDQSRDQDNDDLARTAGELLDKVQDNQSTKFQNSTFLDLMRRLRDREVRVEGDKMVETNLSALEDATPDATPSLRPVQRPVQLDSMTPPAQSGQRSNDIPTQQLRDGEDVVRMLDEPSDFDQGRFPAPVLPDEDLSGDPEFTITMPRPFYDNQYAELGRRGLFHE